ncbi:MAG: serine/threonine protein kinase [Deltaproteobacteria bacterium]|nr:MAG: serine/threonine protein kinase [Deltaproteobacteria bacterium]
MNQGRRFHLQERIGAGAYGEVFLAEQDSGAGFRKRVAIKLLHARLEGMADAGKRFRDEARILGRLSHRHIVTVLDLVQLDERWALIMDFVPGADLERVIDALAAEDETFPTPAAIEVAAAICSALDAAFHADDGAGGTLGVIHRDIKPSNVRLTHDGEVKVLDFGVASVNLETREAQTGLHRMGTERYMAPERILGEDSGQKGDMYAVAATLAELVLGEPIGRTPVLSERHAVFLDELQARLVARLGDDHVLIPELMLGLAEDVDVRPEPREWSTRLAELARREEGETLAAFSRRYVPTVGDVLGVETEVVTGVLSEGSLPATASSTLLPADGDSWLNEGDGATELPTRKAGIAALVVGIGAGLAAVAGIAAIGLAVLQSQSAPPPAPAAIAAPMVEPPPVATPEPVVAEPEPVAVVEPEPEPEPEPKPIAAPEPPKPRPVRPRPVETRGAVVDRAMFVVTDATSVQVTCGDVAGTGSQAVRLRKFSGGSCAITATYLGQQLTGRTTVNEVREVKCTPTDGALRCD